jgi:hypothetical protein
MSVIAQGQVFPGWSGPRPEGPRLEIDSSGMLLINVFQQPTPREVRGYRTGKARFGLVRGGRHTLFLMYDIEFATRSWSDTPFALGLVAPDRRDLPERGPTEGWFMLTVLVDADTGICHALRGISLTPSFSEVFDRLVAEQRAALPDFTLAAHEAEIKAAYAKWRTGDDMISSALAIERGGLKW